MDQLPVSERLPRLYRSVLDAVADLEAQGRRPDGAAIRAEATKAYSGAWNAAAERRLLSLRARATRILDNRRPVSVSESLESLGLQPDLERTTV